MTFTIELDEKSADVVRNEAAARGMAAPDLLRRLLEPQIRSLSLPHFLQGNGPVTSVEELDALLTEFDKTIPDRAPLPDRKYDRAEIYGEHP